MLHASMKENLHIGIIEADFTITQLRPHFVSRAVLCALTHLLIQALYKSFSYLLT